MTGGPDDAAAAGTAQRPVRVLVADDQQLIRDGIASLLAIQPGKEVVGTACDGLEAVDKAVALAPDVVLMDVRMPECDGTQAAALVRRELPACQVVMLTAFDDEQYVVQALRAGAAGYPLKDLPATELASVLRLAHVGIAQFGAQAAGRLAAALAGHKAPASGDASGTAPSALEPPLTVREIDALRLVAGGGTNREIAARLFLSEGTVKNHISRILTRLSLRDSTQAAMYARDHGLI